MGPSRWHTETFVCAVRGHVTPAASVRRLRPGDEALGLDVDTDGVGHDGRRLARCLRCDVWVAARPGADAAETLPPLEDIPVPRRGRALRDALVLRLISLDRAVHSVLFGIVAIGLLVVELHLGPLKSWAQNLLDRLNPAVTNSGQNPSRDFLGRLLHHVLDLKSGELKILMLTAFIYCVVEGVEAVGLWRERRWAEYLTALATAGFLPFEIHELVTRVTALRVGALVVNVAILLYLVWAKRLFGIRGGPEAVETLDARTLVGSH